MTLLVGAAPVPAEVQIGPFTYDISTDPADLDAISDEPVYAAINPSSLLIALEATQDIGQLRDSLLHEILHGVTFVAGLDQDIAPEMLEEIIYRVSPVLLDTLRRNPEVLGFLVSEP